MNPNMKSSTKVLYPALSYKIVGILLEVHNKLGNGFQEKHYQRAVERFLQRDKLNYQKELKSNLFIENEMIGAFYLDFLVEGKIVLELKAVPRLTPKDFRQVRSYLKANDLELGLLVNFRPQKLVCHRILNRVNPNVSKFE